jgi:hypothetical protein
LVKTPLIFAEYADEVADFDIYNHDNIHIIGLQPCVQAKFANSEVLCYNSLAFLDKIGHGQVLKKSAEIVSILRGAFNVIDSLGLIHVYERTLFFYFRFYLHYWLTHIEIVHNAIQKFNPEEIYIPPISSLQEIEKEISCENRLIGAVVRSYIEANNLHIKLIGGSQKKTKKEKKIPNWFRQILFECALECFRWSSKSKKPIVASIDIYNISSVMIKACSEVPNSFPVYLAPIRKNWKNILKSMLLGKMFVFPTLGESPNKAKKQFKGNLDETFDTINKAINKEQSTFNYHGVDLRNILFKYIRTSLSDELVRLCGQNYSIGRIIKRRKPIGFFSPHAVGYGYALGEIAHLNKIPGMLISHGSHVHQNVVTARTEWDEHARTLINTHYPFVAAQSPMAKSFLEQQETIYSKIVKTGPLIFTQKLNFAINEKQLRKRIFGDFTNKMIVLHGGTPKTRESIRPWVYETIDEYINNINDLIKTVEKIPDIHLAIRFRPSESLKTKDFKLLLKKSSCYRIYSDGSFDSYLLSSDLLVSYSSTTIEESLQNRVPVLLYSPDDRYCHVPATSIVRDRPVVLSPVYYANNLSNLQWGMRWLKNHLPQLSKKELDWGQYVYPEISSKGWLNEIGLITDF